MMEKNYTAEQLSDANRIAAIIAEIPEDKRKLIVMMTNSFIAGIEAQKVVDDMVAISCGNMT